MAALIVYFSRAGGNYVNGTIQNLAVGNTELAAEVLAGLTGAETFQLQPVAPYSDDYNECIEQACRDKRRNARPALKAWPGPLDGIDTLFLGYPNYWGTLPMAVCTFLEGCDLAGKTIRPFCTHEGSGLGSSREDLQRLCPGAGIGEGLAIPGGRAAQAEALFTGWIRMVETAARLGPGIREYEIVALD